MKKRSLLLALLAVLVATPVLAQAVQIGDVIRLKYESPAVDFVDKAGGVVWQETLSVPGASYIAPHFSRFALPKGADLIVRSPDNSRSWTYTGFGKSDKLMEDGFWGIHINGDVAILELRAKGPVPAEAVVVDSIGHGYPSTDLGSIPFKTGYLFEEPITKSLCGADNMKWAQCYQSSEPTAYARGRAVVRLLTQKSNGGFLCTGWLVGDEGHMMTNNHCISTQQHADNTTYEFMAEGSCSTNCPQLACPGVIEANSATLVRTTASLDYSLLKLPTNPSGTHGFLQLRSSGPVLNERMYIVQHPSGKGKRIALESTDSSNPSGFCEVDAVNMPSCVSNEIGYRCDTEGGSSGSPVLGYGDHCVIAIHNCGGCNNGGVPMDRIVADLGSQVPADGFCTADPLNGRAHG